MLVLKAYTNFIRKGRMNIGKRKRNLFDCHRVHTLGIVWPNDGVGFEEHGDVYLIFSNNTITCSWNGAFDFLADKRC